MKRPESLKSKKMQFSTSGTVTKMNPNAPQKLDFWVTRTNVHHGASGGAGPHQSWNPDTDVFGDLALDQI